MNRIIVALFRPGKRLPRSPGPAGTEQQPRLLVHSQPLLPFLGGCCVHPKSARPCPCALCLCWLFVARSLPSAGCWRLPGSGPAPQPAGAMGHHTPPNFCTTGAAFANPPAQGEPGCPVDEAGQDAGKKCSGRSCRSPWRAWRGLAPVAPLFGFSCPVPPAVSAPWLTQSGAADKAAALQRPLCPA